jgi:predicted methyltransferase
MNVRTPALVFAALLLAGCATEGPRDSLKGAVANKQRTEAFIARDRYRHPQQTLEFFGLKPDQTVVEIWPAPGWYAEILAPYLRERGKYIAAGFVVSWEGAPQWRIDAMKGFRDKLAAQPELYDRVVITEIGRPDRWEPAPAGSVDLLLTFRNVHNWIAGEYEREMFAAFFKTLKPGGTLAVVEHRAAPGTPIEAMKKSGYVTEEYVQQLAEGAGFQLVAKSEINANPKDTKDYPDGVWTLPPALKLGEKDRGKYLGIGESDRMTMKFVKPQP